MRKNNLVTVSNNPSTQDRDSKIKEICFESRNGEHYGMLMSLRFNHKDEPVVYLYRIDEGIQVSVSPEREKRM